MDSTSTRVLYCAVCSTCSLEEPMIIKFQIWSPDGKLRITLPHPEPRCEKHLCHILCSYCMQDFDSNTATLVVNYGKAELLCPDHKEAERCEACRKWLSKGVSQVNPYLRCACPKPSVEQLPVGIRIAAPNRKVRRGHVEQSLGYKLSRAIGRRSYERYVLHRLANLDIDKCNFDCGFGTSKICQNKLADDEVGLNSLTSSDWHEISPLTEFAKLMAKVH